MLIRKKQSEIHQKVLRSTGLFRKLFRYAAELFAFAAAIGSTNAQIPRAWTQADVASLELPLANRDHSPTHISGEDYYRIPERTIYRSYPVYAPGREPNGYAEWLRTREPEIVFDASKIKTNDQWIAAGELVFRAPTSLHPVFFTAENLRDPAFFAKFKVPVAADGTAPFASWVIRKKGVVELGSMGCNTCHTRVLPDGSVLAGAPGNNPNDREGAQLLRESEAAMGQEKTLDRLRSFARQFELPWVRDDLNRVARDLTLEGFIAAGDAIPPGVTARANTSMFLPPQIPDLIGIRERRYLDHTGLIRHRGIGDLMRYSSLAQDMFVADRYPSMTAQPVKVAARYSDAQLYALSLYLQSLRPPPNPNGPGAPAAVRGNKVFISQKCSSCHTPPLYTNNKLAPVDGFDGQLTGDAGADVLTVRVGTDPRYALDSRKGTGYYKVPSLKGVWYRGPFGHDGAASTLEEWFDPARLNKDYVPRGFRGYDGSARSIPGHPFGLDLTAADRADLIAFLRTL
jgi:hypothetical protein